MKFYLLLLKMLVCTAVAQEAAEMATPLSEAVMLEHLWPNINGIIYPEADTVNGKLNTEVESTHPETRQAVLQQMSSSTLSSGVGMPSNRMQPIISQDVDVVMGVHIAPPETTPVFVSRPIPPNRKKPVINPEKGLVVGTFNSAPLPGFVPTGSLLVGRSSSQALGSLNYKDIQSKISTNNDPIISRADVVMAVMDSVGTIVDNLAEDMAVDLNNMFTASPSSHESDANQDNTGTKGQMVMLGQLAIRDSAREQAESIASLHATP
jgi:hypothetical protein